ncbi:VOC family protein [Erwinia psidii]|uniref:VOC family protein n=1 Tax=Erwinia psidii TaxID=69224 RepID=UPI00226BA710|nr:VOC family protein [Erwinia psidii]MCX8959995.1 VOC family protein [Erwinia psidii]
MFKCGVAEELADLANDLPDFIRSVYSLADKLGLELLALYADHIAVRCFQKETAERWKKGFLRHGELLSEKLINGRPVALVELHQALSVGPWLIPVVELPWPGEKRYRHEGWEHVELVLRCADDQLVSKALALCSGEGLARPGISIKHSVPKGEGERLANPTVAFSDGRVTIKFHPWSLKEIVQSEL